MLIILFFPLFVKHIKYNEMTYFNTTKETGSDLKSNANKSNKQDDLIKSFFKLNPGYEVTASDVWINVFETAFTPLTSIRRSINTLMNLGVIKQVLDEDSKPLKRVCNLYGRKVFVYQLAI